MDKLTYEQMNDVEHISLQTSKDRLLVLREILIHPPLLKSSRVVTWPAVFTTKYDISDNISKKIIINQKISLIVNMNLI